MRANKIQRRTYITKTQCSIKLTIASRSPYFCRVSSLDITILVSAPAYITTPSTPVILSISQQHVRRKLKICQIIREHNQTSTAYVMRSFKWENLSCCLESDGAHMMNLRRIMSHCSALKVSTAFSKQKRLGNRRCKYKLSFLILRCLVNLSKVYTFPRANIGSNRKANSKKVQR